MAHQGATVSGLFYFEVSMKHTLSYNELLNKLPIASTQFLDPYSYRMLDILLRYGYRLEGFFPLPNDVLFYGVSGVTLPLMQFSGKPCSKSTLRKCRKTLENFGVIEYKRQYIEGVAHPVGAYKIVKHRLKHLVQEGHIDALAKGCLSSVFSADEHISEQIRRATRNTLINVAVSVRETYSLVQYSPLESYVYSVVLSIATSVRSYTLKNLPKVLSSIINAPRTSIYRALRSIKRLLTYDSLSKVYAVVIPKTLTNTAVLQRGVEVYD